MLEFLNYDVFIFMLIVFTLTKCADPGEGAVLITIPREEPGKKEEPISVVWQSHY